MVPKSKACKRSFTPESMNELLGLIKTDGCSLYKLSAIIYPVAF